MAVLANFLVFVEQLEEGKVAHIVRDNEGLFWYSIGKLFYTGPHKNDSI